MREIRTLGEPFAEDDERLGSYFIETPAYTGISSGRAFLLVGRRGTGKTAIAKQLAIAKAGAVVQLDYKQVSTFKAEDPLHAWQYILFQCLAGCIASQIAASAAKGKLLDAAATVYGNELNVAMLTDVGSLLSFVEHVYGEAERKKLSESSCPWRALSVHVMSKLWGELRSAAGAANTKLEGIVLIDDTDKGAYFATADHYQKYLTALLVSALAVNEHARKVKNASLKVVVLMRDDIFHSLQFSEKLRIERSFTEFLRWHPKNEPYSLLQLIEKRIAETNPPAARWTDLFSQSTDFNMVCEGTFYRPRDVISYCNSAITFHNTVDAFRNDSRVTTEAIAGAAADYALLFKGDLAAELAPWGALSNTLSVIARMKNDKFRVNEFVDESIDAGSASLADGPVLISALHSLFLHGALAVQTKGGVMHEEKKERWTETLKKGGTRYVWHYIDEREPFDNRPDAMYQVHPMLVRAMSLRKRK
jgi:hypothetical protein